MVSTRTIALLSVLGMAAASMAGIPGASTGTLTPSGTAWKNVLSASSFCWAYDDKYLSLVTNGYNPDERQNHQVGQLNYYNRANNYPTTGTLHADSVLTLNYNVAGGPAIALNFNVSGDYNTTTNCWHFTIPTTEKYAVSGGRVYGVKLTGIGAVGQNTFDLCPLAPGGTSSAAIFAQIRSAAVPEPATFAAMGIGALALMRRKRSK